MVGRQIYHNEFGRGIITKAEDSLITVAFSRGYHTFSLSHPICHEYIRVLPEEENKTICLWGKDFAFSREVIAHFILKDHPEYKDCIEQKVGEWFGDFEGSTYQGDCMTSSKIDFWFNSYFNDKGCDEEHVIPYIQDFLKCFHDSNSLYEQYSEHIGIDTYQMEFNLRNLFYARENGAMAWMARSIFYNVIYLYYAIRCKEQSIVFDYKKSLDIISRFDNEFNWISKYEFNSAWKSAFCLIVHAVYIGIKISLLPKTDESLEFEQTAEAFLKKYLSPINQPLILDFESHLFNRRKHLKHHK